MVVIVLTACPTGLRGDVSRWLLEIAPGVFVGHVSARVRDRLWERIVDTLKDGRAIMVFSARNEQHLDFRVFRSDWQPVDCDGLQLIRHPSEEDAAFESFAGAPRHGWSNAAKYRRARRYGGKSRG
ncbi:type I-E CRISPR-associated endoribonuclease Cas2e [Bifidobacterium choerinum]|uniref:Type I-E CRISPR-associated endoribonuclease Cas2 n=1 Tax=Bifidobacterium choerinum TaxID=35760 RepID=A0A2D3D4B2_9BIFI|nr:type I-E CRISPR-associated endoribonuclease Cas2e [Bifidobacterium choerinum]ATU19686.1 type I-E CRISPR-associated endoribonuclease Cas2 [Bifidobacterium choerinum]